MDSAYFNLPRSGFSCFAGVSFLTRPTKPAWLSVHCMRSNFHFSIAQLQHLAGTFSHSALSDYSNLSLDGAMLQRGNVSPNCGQNRRKLRMVISVCFHWSASRVKSSDRYASSAFYAAVKEGFPFQLWSPAAMRAITRHNGTVSRQGNILQL